MKNIKKYLTIYGEFSILLIYGLVQLLCSFFLMAFPERFTISELDSLAIDINEDVTFILLIISSIIMIVSFVVNLFIGIKLFNISLNKYSIFHKVYENKKLWKTCYVTLLLLSITLSFIMIFIYIYNAIYIKRIINDKDQVVFEKLMFNYQIRKYNKFIRISSIVVPLSLLSISTIPVAVLITQEKTLYVNSQDVNNFLSLSNNHENTLMLYFDRAQGMLWNSLLWYDNYLYKDESFMSMFPEFTSFVKTFSQGRVTSTSNPSLVSGALYSSWMNNISEKSLYSSINYNNMNMIDFWNEAFYNSFKGLYENGVSDIHISSVPYYSYNGSEYGKPNLIDVPSQKLNSEIPGTKNDINFAFTTNEAIAADKFNYNKADRMTNALVLRESPNILQYKNTNGGVYLGWYFHHIHEKYCYYNFETNKYEEADSTDYKYFMQSIWFTIQELKSLFLKLKNEPWSDGKTTSNIYDHTQILIVSDHGYSMPKFNSSVSKFLNLVKKENNLKKEFDPTKHVLLSYNNIFMIKPFSDKSNKNSSKFFDKDTFITSADIPLTIEEGLNKYRGTNNSYFYPDLNKINDLSLRNYFRQFIIQNPMANKSKLSNRIIKLEVSDWRFNPSWHYQTKKTFNINASGKDYYDLLGSDIIFNKK